MIKIPERINLASYYLDRNLEEGRGDKVAVHYKDERFTYAQIAALSNKVGNVLKDIGIEPEDRVLIVLNDSPEFIASWFGIIKMGAVSIDVYSFLQTKDYEYFLNYTRAKAAIVAESIVARFQKAAEKSKFLKNLIVVGRRVPDGALSFHRAVENASAKLEPEDTHADDVALWKFTSGTTGRPKGVVLTHRNSIYNFLCFGKKILHYRENDITLSVPKLFFGYARDAGVVYAFGSGASAAIFPERSTVETIFNMIEKYRPTVLINVPTMINAMVSSPDAKKYDLSCIRFSTSAGEALPKELYYRWKKTFGSEILDFIGSAELYHGYLSNSLNDVKPGSLGKVVPGYEAKIVNENGIEVPDGEVGTLWVKGDSAGLFYWNDYEKTKKTFRGEWVDTGDLFWRDNEGYYWFAGRQEEVLKVGGIFVAPLEIENCLLAHPAVRECAVVGASDAQGLIKPKAFIVVNSGFKASAKLAEEIQSYVKQTLAPYKYPRWIEFVERLPKDDRGKVRKRELREK